MEPGCFFFDAVADHFTTSQSFRSSSPCSMEEEQISLQKPSAWISRDEEVLKDMDVGPDKKYHNIRRSYMSFSGRCVPARPKCDEATWHSPNPALPAVATPWSSTNPKDYSAWYANFFVSSCVTNLPSVLISVAPLFFPYTSELSLLGAGRPSIHPESASALPKTSEEKDLFEKKMLHTPLIWEEPHTLSIEIRKNGIFLWSDQWKLYGKKISEKGFGEALSEAVLKPIISTDPVYRDLYETASLPCRWDALIRVVTETSAVARSTEGLVSPAAGTIDEGAARKLVLRVFLGEATIVTKIEHDPQPSIPDEESLFLSHSSFAASPSEKETMTIDIQWKEVGIETFFIEKEASSTLFTPYVTLLAHGDAAALVGSGSLQC